MTCHLPGAGVCQYEIHEDDLQYEEMKAEYDKLTQKEKDKCASGPAQLA